MIKKTNRQTSETNNFKIILYTSIATVIWVVLLLWTNINESIVRWIDTANTPWSWILSFGPVFIAWVIVTLWLERKVIMKNNKIQYLILLDRSVMSLAIGFGVAVITGLIYFLFSFALHWK